MIKGTAIHYGDAIVIAVYFAFILFVGLWVYRMTTMITIAQVAASLFASNIGSLQFVGLAGSGATSGLACGLYILSATFMILVLAYIYLPIYIASGVYTMPEYMKLRFGGRRIQIYLALLSLIAYIFTKISADLYSGAIFIRQSLDLNIYIAVVILLSVAALFTIAGGLTAVIWTDFIQTIIMLVGAVALAIIAFLRVGGINGIMEKYQYAIPNTTLYSNTTCGYPNPDYMHMFRSASDYDFPWPGIVGMTINSMWYWCTDQVIVQRVLGARSIGHGKAGAIICGYLKLTPLFLLVFPGMIARILFPDTVGCADPAICTEICGSPSGCGVIAYPTLVLNLMPAGARGLMLAVMLSALMSSLTSIFNSSSTIFSLDIWTHFRKNATEREVMIVGRMFVAILVVISVLWVTVIQASEGSDLFTYIQKVSSFIQPPMCAIFLLGILWPRLNEKGAFWGMTIGIVSGLVRFAVEYSYTSPLCGEDTPDPRPNMIKNFPYLYFSMLLFTLTIIAAVVISLLTKPIPHECLYRLTFWTRHSTTARVDIDYVNKDTRSDVNTVEFTDIKECVIADSDEDTNNDERMIADIGKYPDEEHVTETDLMSSNNAFDCIGDRKKTRRSTLEFGNAGDNTSVGARSRAWFACCLSWLCGLNEGSTQPLNAIPRPSYLSISENPLWSKVGIAATVGLVVCSVFLHVYFG